MKTFLVLLIILSFIKVYSRTIRIARFEKAFIDISEALGKQNHEVSIVADKNSRKLIDSIGSVAIAEVPHNVARFKNTEWFLLNTSAIVLLDSVT